MKKLFLNFLFFTFILISACFSSQKLIKIGEDIGSRLLKSHSLPLKSISNEQDVTHLINYFNEKNKLAAFTQQEKNLTKEAYDFVSQHNFIPRNRQKFSLLEKELHFESYQFQRFYLESTLALIAIKQENDLIYKDFKEQVNYLSFLVYEPEVDKEEDRLRYQVYYWSLVAIPDFLARKALIHNYEKGIFFEKNEVLAFFWKNYHQENSLSSYNDAFEKMRKEMLLEYFFPLSLKEPFPTSRSEWYAFFRNIH